MDPSTSPSVGPPRWFGIDDTKIGSPHYLAASGGHPSSLNGLPAKDCDGNPVSFSIAPNQTVDGSQEQQTFHFHRDFVNMLLNRKNIVQERRSQLVAQFSELRQLWSQLEKLADDFVSVAERQLTQVDPPLKLSDLLELVKNMQKEMKSRGRVYDTAEAELRSEEVGLVATENELYQSFELSSFYNESPKYASVSSPTAEMLRTTSQHPSPRTTNPLYDYERKIGLANRLHERILDMISDRAEILEEQRQLSSGTLEQEDVHFLETYEESFASRVRELDVLELEISRLEKEAINSGLLHPSARYYRTRPWAVDPVSLGPPAIDLTDKRSGVNSVIVVPPGLPDSGQASVAQMSQLPTPFRPGSYIHRWLSGLPLSFMPANPGQGLSQLWSQICPASEENAAQKPSSISGGPVPEPIGKGWVRVVRTGSEREWERPSHTQNVACPGDNRAHPKIEDSSGELAPKQRLSDPGFSSGSPCPNQTHITPVKPYGNAPTSSSL